MTAKEYLSQAYRIDLRINSKIEQVAALKELALKATNTLSDMPSGTRNVHSKENIIAKMLDLENEINAEIDRLVDLKHDIVKAIKTVPDFDCRTLLELRYLNLASWEKISRKLGISLRTVYRLHDKAIKEIKIFKN